MIFIDGDVLLYRAGFSAELPMWGVVDSDGECYIWADSKELALKHVQPGERVERMAEPLPFSRAVLHLKNDISEIVKNCCKFLDTPEVGVVIFLSHPDRGKNDRFKVAVTHPYKGNRKKMAQPIHKEAIQNYMLEMDNVTVVEGIEADDALGTSLVENPGSICASIDKDLLMVPGIHYNFKAKDFTEASDPGGLELVQRTYGKHLKGHGFMWFCAQMLMGDSVDNIVGLRGYGPVRAHKLLSETTPTIKALWNMVVNMYAIAGEDESRVQENADLLWIRRERGQTFREWMGVHSNG